MNDLHRFANKIVTSPGCWLWQATLNEAGCRPVIRGIVEGRSWRDLHGVEA